MIFRPTREARGDPRFFKIKVVVLVLGASLGLAGMTTERSWLVYAGIGVLAVGLVLRMIAARSREE